MAHLGGFVLDLAGGGDASRKSEGRSLLSGAASAKMFDEEATNGCPSSKLNPHGFFGGVILVAIACLHGRASTNTSSFRSTTRAARSSG
jgi:hypothetical protein